MGLIEVWLWQTCGPIAYGWIMLETIFKDYAPFISIMHNIQTDNLLMGLQRVRLGEDGSTEVQIT